MLTREGTTKGLTWVGRLAVMGGIAALAPLASIRAQSPRSEVAHPSGRTGVDGRAVTRAQSPRSEVAHPSEKGTGKGSDFGDREAVEKARAKVEELEEEAEAKYTEFKKAVRHLERAEERLAELRGHGGRPAHEAFLGFADAGHNFGNNPEHPGMQGFETHGFGMPGMGMHPMQAMPGMGMHPMPGHPGMGMGRLREIDAKLDRLREEIEELRRDRDRGASKSGSRSSRSESRSDEAPAQKK